MRPRLRTAHGAIALAALAGACATPPQAPPAVALDHVWIATPRDATEACAALERAGFRIAPTVNRHDGQGTASLTVEFENGFLELIWADESVPVHATGAIAQQRFAQRADWRRSGHSPFGLAVTRTPATPSPLPFETWTVTSDWMEPGTSTEMWTPRGSPALHIAVHPFATDENANLRRIAQGGQAAWPFLHENGARRMTAVAVTAPAADGLPPSAQLVRDSGAVRFEFGDAWRMDLTLDEGERGATLDLRPALPLVVHH